VDGYIGCFPGFQFPTQAYGKMRFSKILNRLSQIVIPPDFLGRFKILRKAAAFFAQAELDRKLK